MATEAIRTITVRARTEGVQQSVRDINEFGNAAKSTALAIQTSTAAAAGAISVAYANIASGAAAASGAMTGLERVGVSAALRLVTRWAGIAGAVITAVQALQYASREARNEMESLARIGDQAGRAGVGTTLFQTFTAQAAALKVEVADLERALINFRSNTSDTFRNVSSVRGRLNDFSTFGVGLGSTVASGQAQFDSARTQEDRLRAVLQIMADLEAAGQRLAALDLAETAFGGGRLVERLREGQITFQEFQRAAAASAEGIVPATTIRRAEELRDRIEASTTAVRDGLKPVFQDIVAIGIGVAGIGVRLTEGLATATAEAGRLYVRLRDAALLNNQIFARQFRDAITQYDRLAETNPALARATQRGALDNANALGASVFGGTLEERAAAINRGLQGQRPSIDAILNPRTVPQPPNMPADLARQRESVLLNPGTSSSGSSTSTQSADSIFRSIERQTAVLKAQADMFGQGERAIAKHRAEQELLTQAQQQGIPLTDELRTRISTMATAYADADERLRELRRSQEDFNQLTRFAGQNISSFFSDIVAGGQSASRALEQLVKRLADAALQAALLGDGPLAGLFGTRGVGGNVGGLLGALFNGGGAATSGTGSLFDFLALADGGFVSGAGGPRDDMVPAMLSNGEFVVNAAATKRYLPLLEKLNARKFADGGLVDRTSQESRDAAAAALSGVMGRPSGLSPAAAAALDSIANPAGRATGAHLGYSMPSVNVEQAVPTPVANPLRGQEEQAVPTPVANPLRGLDQDESVAAAHRSSFTNPAARTGFMDMPVAATPLGFTFSPTIDYATPAATPAAVAAVAAVNAVAAMGKIGETFSETYGAVTGVDKASADVSGMSKADTSSSDGGFGGGDGGFGGGGFGGSDSGGAGGTNSGEGGAKDGGLIWDGRVIPTRRYARGGVAYGPQAAVFGEGSRPEAYVPLPDGRSIPVTMQGGGGGIVIHNYSQAEVQADRQNDGSTVIRIVQAALKEYDKQLPRRVGDLQRRGMI